MHFLRDWELYEYQYAYDEQRRRYGPEQKPEAKQGVGRLLDIRLVAHEVKHKTDDKERPSDAALPYKGPYAVVRALAPFANLSPTFN